jgi:myo-inositol-1(or 4)-monophosphatase
MIEEMISIVQRAGELLTAAQDIGGHTHEKHGAADLVTDYDVAVQDFLRRELLTLCPDAAFFGEEGHEQSTDSRRIFVVDPIDGTTNFVRGFSCSNIAAALVEDGAVRASVVYNPFLGELFSAERGAGAFLNGKPIHVSGRDLAHAIVLCGSTIYDRSLTERHFALMRRFYELGLDYRRFGAAELDFCQVAAGRAEVFFECRLSPWDFAAGSLILEEAGGQVTQLDGSPLTLFAPCSVLATNDACRGAAQLL